MKGIYPARGRVFRPWKNGGGQTAEIAVSPVAADMETFSWRVSVASVASDGPFSEFPGIDRVLTVTEGGPMVLEIGGREHLLDETSPPFAFSGEAPVMARLCGPPLLDFNVMCRRPLRAEVVKGPFQPAQMLSGSAQARLVLLLEPRAGFERLDLIDLDARPEAGPALRGAATISVRIIG
ncbi:HutD/Ves family protein [Pseudogemmobacter humi]|uniref:HutD family protein n=1 Tax=Pseudogemmobacter humi TaxID=2483812 RepID=A0A3P5WWR3_9RHOB|nr:HutD family protein [Pseudogemmobacter humi]VDC20457.1 hypothetical protein XINFAN_00508 [Pseudogemmobacter humi]